MLPLPCPSLRGQRWRRFLPLLGLAVSCLLSPTAPAALPALKVTGWGANDLAQRTIPATLTNAVLLSGGQGHSLILRSNGIVVAVGQNYYGQTNLPPGLSNAIAVAAGGKHSLALLANGQVAAWGNNDYEQSTVPTIPGEGDELIPYDNVVAIAAGWHHSLALLDDGSVLGWGDNSFVQAEVPAGIDATAIAAGGHGSLALLHDGTVVAWGDNNSEINNPPDGLDEVAAIARGGYHNLALKSDGTVVAWGRNDFGQTDVPAGLSNVIAIAAGNYFSLALKTDRKVVLWGDAGSGPVPATATNVSLIAGGGFHSLALTGPLPAFIQRQPVAQTIFRDNDVEFFVRATGPAPLTYQWRFNGTNLAGATGASLVIPSAQTNHAGTYTCVLSSPLGSIQSTAAQLVVRDQPAITEHPASYIFLTNEAAPVTFRVNAIGKPPLQFQWQRDGTNMVGLTNTILVLSNASAADAGLYACYVSNPDGNETSEQAGLVFVTPLDSRIVQTGAEVTLRSEISGPGTPRWIVNGIEQTSVIEPSLTLTNAADNQGGSYTLRVSYGDLHRDLLATLWVVALSPDANHFNQTEGFSFNMAISATPATGLTYQWSHNEEDLPGATSHAYKINTVTPANAGVYSVVISATEAVRPLQFRQDFTVLPPFRSQPAAWRSNTFSLSLTFATDAGYVLEYLDDLSRTNWMPAWTNSGTGQVQTLEDTTATGPQRFYRIRRLEP